MHWDSCPISVRLQHHANHAEAMFLLCMNPVAGRSYGIYFSLPGFIVMQKAHPESTPEGLSIMTYIWDLHSFYQFHSFLNSGFIHGNEVVVAFGKCLFQSF